MAEKTSRQNVTFESAGQTAHGYLAQPPGMTGPGVIVVQEWWGLDDHIVDICDRLAGQGFVALAPDLYGGRITHDGDEAGEMMQALPAEKGAELLGGAVDYLLGADFTASKTLGVIGFCMGGGFALALANQQGDRISACVPFYGVGQAVPNSFSGITAAVQGHYAEKDEMYPVDQAKAQEKQIKAESGADVEYFYYDAGHAFHNDENNLGTYDAEAARTAWDRAVRFLQHHVH